ncbi:hypothetical protein GPECTOR_89g512 [Gonium pectorale]|uniref:Protein kinase domain-containing protein n=1 Tax=Gonium pectorale TaxID=33097 RepID=A0A150G0W7_GONPE|nr:hypothetical protein GPECTOR_89g512 [Gonium pectorale]|eukprot:KXZ43492.1 hypothetical protein GPECTOR_89g512 [Gonium pectorale]
MDVTRKATAKCSVLVGCRAALLLAVICFASLTDGQRSEVIGSSLPESLAAGGAVQAGSGASTLTGSALLPAGTYQPLDVQSVEVVGRLVVAGSGPGEGGGGEAATGGGSTAITTLDLTAFQDGPAFWTLNGSSLELHNLTVLLPPAPSEALTAQPPSVLSHVIGGSPARVTLSGLWRLGDPEVRHGVVTFSDGSMPLAVPGIGSAASASTSLPPPALLLRTRVTCCGEAGPQPPFACGAAAVTDAAGLRATAAELMAEMGLAPSSVLVWLAANVTLDPDTWGGPLEVPAGVYLLLFGNQDPGAATQLDFGGIESAIHTDKGVVQIQDLVLLGLPYPSTVGDLRAALAAWVHSVGVPRVSIVAGAGGITRINARDNSRYPINVLDSCLLLSLEESGAVASPRAAAAAATWPLLRVFEGDAAQILLRNMRVQVDRTPEESLERYCPSEAEAPHDVTVLVPTVFGAPVDMPDMEGVTGNATLVVTNDYVGLRGAPLGIGGDSPCTLMGWPASQTGRRTMWDLMGHRSQMELPPSSPLTLVDMVLYNLAPLVKNPTPPADFAVPPVYGEGDAPPPAGPAGGTGGSNGGDFGGSEGGGGSTYDDGDGTDVQGAGQARAPGPLLAASHPLVGLLRTALEVAGDQTVRLLQPIGSGSYGTVYLGLWRGLPVAAKILVVHDTLLGPDGRRRQRAILEAAIGTTLEHPNVVATYAFDVKPLGVQPSGSEKLSEEAEPLWRQMGTQQSLQRNGGVAAARNSSVTKAGSDGKADASAATPSSDVYQLYILQELCSGGSIKEALEPMRALSGGLRADACSAAISLHLAFQVACGLRHVHAAGIVHGDISAGNVLLARQAATAPDGDTGGLDEAERSWRCRLTRPGVPPPPPVVAKVADFGLSLRLTGSRTHASGLYQGTPVYMAPEVVANGRVSPASDVFSFGVLLLELVMGMCTGALLEAAATAPLVAAELRNPAHAHPLLAVLRVLLPPGSPHCPPELSRLAASCVAPVPGQRPTMEQRLPKIDPAAGQSP